MGVVKEESQFRQIARFSIKPLDELTMDQGLPQLLGGECNAACVESQEE
jgi:hypothetical protein